LPASWPGRERIAPDDPITIRIEPEDADLERAVS
jgi:hypothetical protein